MVGIRYFSYIYHSVMPYVCIDTSCRRLSRGLLLLCHEARSFPVTGGMWLCRWRIPSLLLVVAEGCRGVLLPCVQDPVSILFGKSIHVTFFFFSNATFFPYGKDTISFISSWCDTVRVIKIYTYRSLSGGLLHLCHEDRFSPGREALSLVGGKSRACLMAGGCRGVLLLCLQDSVSIWFGRSTHVTIFFVSNGYGISLLLGYDTFHRYHSLIPYVCVDSSCFRLSRGLLLLCHEARSFPVTGGMLLCRWRNPSLLLVVAEGCRGILLACVQDPVSILFGKSIHVIIFFVSNRHIIPLWLGYDLFHMYHGVIPYV